MHAFTLTQHIRVMKAVLGMSMALVCVSSCASSYGAAGGTSDRAVFSPQDQQRQETIQSALTSLAGRKYNSPATVKGKDFRLDCIGLVSAAYWAAGLDITREFGKFAGNGVTRLWASLQSHGLLASRSQPRPGEIVFWDNTWDANEDGIFGNDGHTHAGIVSRIEADGTIWYWHASVSRGVVEAFMNLGQPGKMRDSRGKNINSPMYLGAGEGRAGNPPRWLSGDLYSGKGQLDGMTRYYQVR